MKRTLYIVVLAGFFLGAMTLSGLAASEHEAHHPADTPTAVSSTPGMMGQNQGGMESMPCMATPAKTSSPPMMGMMGKGMGDMMNSGMSNMMGMMGTGKMEMMEQRSAHLFYLDRATELGFSSEQVGKLKAIQLDCLKDSIRNAAEIKIARLELADLLGNDHWSMKDAEPLIRKVQTLEGDLQVRHLQALSDAQKVLTADQLKQARSGENSANLEGLFQ